MKKLFLFIFIFTSVLYAETTLNTLNSTTVRDDGSPIPTRYDAYTNGELEIDRIPTKQLNEDPADPERITNTWDGSVNTFWANPGNWSLGIVPIASHDVIIPDTDQTILILLQEAECNHLTIEADAIIEVWDQTLTVNGDLTVSGQISMVDAGATIDVMGDVVWESGSSIDVTSSFTYFRVYGDWNFNSGANVNMENAVVYFVGTSDSWIRCYSDNSSFYYFTLNKTGGAIVKYSNLSTEDLVVYDLSINSGSTFHSLSNNDIVIGNDFRYIGTFDLTQNSNTGSIIFNGIDQEIYNSFIGSGFFNNIVISSSVATTIDSDNVDVRGDLVIAHGTFNLNGNAVDVQNNVLNDGTLYVDDNLYIGNDIFLYSGSVVDLSGSIQLGTFDGNHGSAYHYSGSIFNQTGGNYYVESIRLDYGSQFNGTGGYTRIYANGFSNDNTIEIDDPDSYFYKFNTTAGTNAELYDCAYDLEVNDILSLWASLDVNWYEINANYINIYDELIIDSGGSVNTTNSYAQFHTGSILTMVSGSELNSASGI